MTENFKTLEISADLVATIVTKKIENLPAFAEQNPVTIQVAYSSLNYKDALSAAGHKGITRSYPHTPGIDATGVVTKSEDPRFLPGQKVIVTSYDLGMNTSGGLAEYIRVPGKWVIPLPEGMTMAQSMSWGTAGLTVAIAMAKIKSCGQTPENGPIVVTGASGGVGSLAVLLLAHAGYTVWASSGKSEQHARLLELGAARCLSREDVNDTKQRPVLRSQWAGAIDTVGGNTLSTLIRACEKEGCIAVCGLVASPNFDATVYPWILNGVNVLGVDSAEYAQSLRNERWQELAQVTSALAPQLEALTQDITLNEVPDILTRMREAKSSGRYRVIL